MPNEDKDYVSMLGLTPSYIEGQDPGSTYKVIARSARGYVGVRRLSKYAYRIRCERFDKTQLLTVNDQALMVSLHQMKLKVGQDGKRVSGTFLGQRLVLDACAALTALLLSNEKDLDTMENCADPHYLDVDAKIDAQKNMQKAAAGDIDALNRDMEAQKVLAPVDPEGGEVN